MPRLARLIRLGGETGRDYYLINLSNDVVSVLNAIVLERCCHRQGSNFVVTGVWKYDMK